MVIMGYEILHPQFCTQQDFSHPLAAFFSLFAPTSNFAPVVAKFYSFCSHPKFSTHCRFFSRFFAPFQVFVFLKTYFEYFDVLNLILKIFSGRFLRNDSYNIILVIQMCCLKQRMLVSVEFSVECFINYIFHQFCVFHTIFYIICFS